MHQFIWRQRHRTDDSKAGSRGIIGNTSPGDACVLRGLTVVTDSQVPWTGKLLWARALIFLKKSSVSSHCPLPAWVQRTGLGLENWVRARLGRPLCQHCLFSPSRTHAYSRTGTLTQQPGTHIHLRTPGPVLCAISCNCLEATRVSAGTLGFLQPHMCLPTIAWDSCSLIQAQDIPLPRVVHQSWGTRI